jgi:hypothetical protein
VRVPRWRNIVIVSDSHFMVWAAVLFVAAIGWILRDFVMAEWHARDAEREVIALSVQIPNNASHGQVADIFKQGNYKHLTLSPHNDNDRWFIQTPSRMGAKDWILTVDFERGHAVSVRVGTADNTRIRPEGAPLDRTLK